MLLPQVSQAFSWENVWERPDQQAVQALEQNDPKKAATLFEEADWKGIAHYRAGDYEQAEQAFSGLDSPEGHYNRGNALAKLGKFPEAMASYQAALTQQPDHGDAQHNLDLLKKMLEDQQQKGEGGKSDPQNQDEASEQSEQKEGASREDSTQEGQEKESSSSSAQDSAEKRNEPEDAESRSASQEHDPNPEEAEQSDAAQASPGEDEKDAEAQEQLTSASQSEEAREEQKSEQALQQWLRRIPDDPGGLLRRKFILEHRRRVEAGTAVDSSGRPW